MIEKFDVIIVGCGPAGLFLAEKLSEKGMLVLALDKKQEIGAPKRCAEGLGLGWFKRLDLKASSDWAVQPIKGAALYAPSGKKVEIRFDEVSGYILERKVFEKFLARNAAKKGALIKARHEVIDLIKENNKIIGVKARFFDEIIDFKADLIISAEGIESIIARKAGLNTTLNLYHTESGFQYELTNINGFEDDLIHLFFGNEIAPRGYQWLFPKPMNSGNVGVGIAAFELKTAKYYLDKFIASRKEFNEASIIEVNAGAIPVGGFLDKMTLDNFMVIGDSAHQVSPIHGGGIGLAMESALIASNVIEVAFKKKNYSNEILSKYDSLWFEKRGKFLKNELKKRIMIEKLSDKDFEILASTFNGSELLKIASGSISEVIALISKKLITKPSFAKLLIKYLTQK